MTPCTKGNKPHEDVPEGTTLFLVDPGGVDQQGREHFTMVWFAPHWVGRTEIVPISPGSPKTRVHTHCGHRAQCFHAVLSEYTKRAEAQGETVVVSRKEVR